MQDPIADMLTRIRNGQCAKHTSVTMHSSKIKERIAQVMKDEGYITDFSIEKLENGQSKLTIVMKYYYGKPVIEKIKRVSRPGLRVYQKADKLQSIPGFGIAILSTPLGVMSHTVAKKQHVGGEVLCEIV